MNTYILYTTSHCHLCDQAYHLIHNAVPTINLICIEIANNDDLMTKYAIRIPVIKKQGSTSELDWPFNKDEIIEMCT